MADKRGQYFFFRKKADEEFTLLKNLSIGRSKKKNREHNIQQFLLGNVNINFDVRFFFSNNFIRFDTKETLEN